MNQPAQTVEQIQTRCCIVGGGLAGMMLGFLLARRRGSDCFGKAQGFPA
jgi:cation diffusion facilitator CzcD-associated flavoprotein CzcO